MCSHYEGVPDHRVLKEVFRVEPPAQLGKQDLWPGYEGLLIRRPREKDSGDEAVPDREALPALFGLVPHWATDLKICRSTFNARSETVAGKPSFRDAWKKGQNCIIPAQAIYEPDWRSGKAIPTRITRTDGRPMGIAGLWSSWKSPKGEWVHSFTMLTINAEHHPLMKVLHKPTDEKRMLVILQEPAFDEWLAASPEQSKTLLERLTKRCHRAGRLSRLTHHGTKQEQADQRGAMEEDQAAAAAGQAFAEGRPAST